jgi:hypothetical protein
VNILTGLMTASTCSRPFFSVYHTRPLCFISFRRLINVSTFTLFVGEALTHDLTVHGESNPRHCVNSLANPETDTEAGACPGYFGSGSMSISNNLAKTVRRVAGINMNSRKVIRCFRAKTSQEKQ